MEIIGLILIAVGVLWALISGIWFLVEAFRVSIWWGLACLFLPVVSFFFLIVHWSVAKRPFFHQILAIVLIIIGVIIAPQQPLIAH